MMISRLMLRIWRKELSDNLWSWIAWRLPRRLVYWSSVRLMTYGTVGKYGTQKPNQLTIDEALRRWGATHTHESVSS